MKDLLCSTCADLQVTCRWRLCSQRSQSSPRGFAMKSRSGPKRRTGPRNTAGKNQRDHRDLVNHPCQSHHNTRSWSWFGLQTRSTDMCFYSGSSSRRTCAVLSLSSTSGTTATPSRPACSSGSSCPSGSASLWPCGTSVWNSLVCHLCSGAGPRPGPKGNGTTVELPSN